MRPRQLPWETSSRFWSPEARGCATWTGVTGDTGLAGLTLLKHVLKTELGWITHAPGNVVVVVEVVLAVAVVEERMKRMTTQDGPSWVLAKYGGGVAWLNSGQIWERLSIRAEVCRTIPQNWQLIISCCVWQHYQTEWLSSLPNVFVVRVETKTSAVADASLKSRHPFASTDDRAECFFCISMLFWISNHSKPWVIFQKKMIVTKMRGNFLISL